MREKILFDDVLKKIPNKYILTIVTGKRVRELAGGAEPLSKIKGKSKICISFLRAAIGAIAPM